MLFFCLVYNPPYLVTKSTKMILAADVCPYLDRKIYSTKYFVCNGDQYFFYAQRQALNSKLPAICIYPKAPTLL